MKTLTILLVSALLPALGIAKEKDKTPAVPKGSLTDVHYGAQVNDAAFNKDELAGKVVVVEEWGTHCGPCLASLPKMAKLAKSEEKKGLVVVGLEAQGSSKEEILKVLKSAHVEYPVMAGGSAPGGTGTIPHVCVFDTTGKLVWNGNPLDDNFERAVKKQLREVKKGA